MITVSLSWNMQSKFGRGMDKRPSRELLLLTSTIKVLASRPSIHTHKTRSFLEPPVTLFLTLNTQKPPLRVHGGSWLASVKSPAKDPSLPSAAPKPCLDEKEACKGTSQSLFGVGSSTFGPSRALIIKLCG